MLLAEISPLIGIGGGVLILCWLMMRRRLRAGSGATSSSYSQTAGTAAGQRFFRSSLTPPNKNESDRALGLMDAPSSIARWEVAMHDVARDLRAELDTKMVAIQAMLIQSREECNRLSRLIERAEQLGLAPTRDTLRTVEDLGSDNPQEIHAALQSLSAMSEPSTVPGTLPETLVRQIYNLADQGRTSNAIAKQLGAPLGDVEFALGIRTPESSPRE